MFFLKKKHWSRNKANKQNHYGTKKWRPWGRLSEGSSYIEIVAGLVSLTLFLIVDVPFLVIFLCQHILQHNGVLLRILQILLASGSTTWDKQRGGISREIFLSPALEQGMKTSKGERTKVNERELITTVNEDMQRRGPDTIFKASYISAEAQFPKHPMS